MTSDRRANLIVGVVFLSARGFRRMLTFGIFLEGNNSSCLHIRSPPRRRDARGVRITGTTAQVAGGGGEDPNVTRVLTR